MGCKLKLVWLLLLDIPSQIRPLEEDCISRAPPGLTWAHIRWPLISHSHLEFRYQELESASVWKCWWVQNIGSVYEGWSIYYLQSFFTLNPCHTDCQLEHNMDRSFMRLPVCHLSINLRAKGWKGLCLFFHYTFLGPVMGPNIYSTFILYTRNVE